MPIGRLLIVFGLVLVASGIVIGRDNFRLYVPLATSLLISVVLSLVLWLLNR